MNIKKFFSKSETDSKCIVLYNWDFDRTVTKDLFKFLNDYFKRLYNIDFKYCGFYNESYNEQYGRIEPIVLELAKNESDSIVNLVLDDNSSNSGKRTMSIEFNVTRPIHTTLVIPKDFTFDIHSFTNEYYNIYKTIYGFTYFVNIDKWPTAYAIGDWQHSVNLKGINKVSKEDGDRWFKDCEKIKDGFLRGVYNENILSSAHLEKMIGKESLKSYIKSENVGKLVAINEEVFMWTIDYNLLEKARQDLNKSGIIL